MSANPDMHVIDRLRQAALSLVKTAASSGLGSLLAAGGAGAAAAGIPIALMMRAHERDTRAKARNVGFGAGVATGLATPAIVRGLYDMTKGPAQ
jgi:hypothetical protein